MASVQKTRKLDRIDRNILTILQQEGRISYTELADRVGLSTTPCMERVKRLERDGVITGYHARVNPEMLDYNLLVFVEIALSYQSPDAFEKFNNNYGYVNPGHQALLAQAFSHFTYHESDGDLVVCRQLLDPIAFAKRRVWEAQ